MDVVIAALLLALGLSMAVGRAAATRERHLILIAAALAISFLLLARDASAIWREEFPTLDSLPALNIGDSVQVDCEADEEHPSYDGMAWPPRWQKWEAQVLAEDSPQVWTLGVYPDLMVGKTSFEQFWYGEIFVSELPYVELKDFGVTWPDIGPDVGSITIQKTTGEWEIHSHTRNRHYGWCGNNQYNVMVGNRIDVVWDEAQQAFLGTMTLTGLPGFCSGRRWQPYRCDTDAVLCRQFCPFLAEDDGRWEELLSRMRKWVTNSGWSVAEAQNLIQWQLAKLETYTTSNVCTQAGDESSAPRVIDAQCEVVQALIEGALVSSAYLSVFVPEYQRLECPCHEDADSNGLPDYFDYAEPAQDCPDVAVMPETTEHDEYLIPVPEPPVALMAFAGVAGLLILNRWRSLRGY